MRWRKLGLVFCPTGDRPWARQYAHLPTPVLLDQDRIRIYFAGLDERKFGRIGYVDVDAERPTRVVNVSTVPVLDMGQPGLFDDSGVNPSCVLRIGDVWRMYYIGWQRSHQVPYHLFTGLAESADGERYNRVCRVPVFGRTEAEPFLRSAPSILRTESGYRAWYVSATDWISVRGEPYPRYVVRVADSLDGVNWSAGRVSIDLTSDEFGIGRPWVVRDPDRYRMWYSIRSHSRPYRIGYAESTDGRQWERLDHRAGIPASDTGWDSEMICYAAVINTGGRRIMFHNGNQHGRSGFGVAVLEGDE